jgi:hypothetical protein
MMTLNHLNQNAKKGALLVRNDNLVKEVARLKKENREIRILYQQLKGTKLRFHSFSNDKEVQTEEKEDARNTKSIMSPIKVQEKTILETEEIEEKMKSIQNININKQKKGKKEFNKVLKDDKEIEIINKDKENIKGNDNYYIGKQKSKRNTNKKSIKIENSFNDLEISASTPKQEIQDKSFKILDESFKFIKSNECIDNSTITSSPNINMKERRNIRRPVSYKEISRKVKMRSSFQFKNFAPIDSLRNLPQNNALDSTSINQIEEHQDETNTEDIILQITKSNEKENRKIKKKK